MANEDTIKIELEFDRKTYCELRQAVMVRNLSLGSDMVGLQDIFVARLIEEIDKGATEWLVKKKKELP